MTPTNLILDCKEELAAFRRVVEQPDLPTPDLEAALQQIVDAVVPQNSIDELHDLAAGMCHGEALFSNANLPSHLRDQVWRSVTTFGEALRSKLNAIGAYRNGFFDYEFERLIDRDTIHLSVVKQF